MFSTLDTERFANRNPSDEHHGFLFDSVQGEGKYKRVTNGTYGRSGAPAADKYLKTGATFSSDCFDDDVRAAEAALKYIAAFHRYTETTVYRGKISIKVNIPQVWMQSGGVLVGQKMLREPFIENFQKFNSNSGAADVTATVAQALSHFSYHASDGRELLCDLQGGKIGDSYVLSDVVMMSMEKKFGNTDLGSTGIENWLSAHRCNQFCCSGWKNWSGARQHFQPVFSTTTTLEAATAPAIGPECVRVRPSAIMFTHDSIKDGFQDGHSLLQTALQIAREEVGKRDIPMIAVVRVGDGRLFALDNRRLAVFRLLEMCGRVGTIKVEIVLVWTRWADEWKRKVTTRNGGISVLIRGGRYRIGRNEQETNYPHTWLQQIRKERDLKMMPDDHFSIFLGTFTDE
ncbi:elongation factor 2 kinase [Seminavis robusta]|uniref:Elongation factor 2 kinase n=1 Tax=Seminavis robusta TaxID=568900 RepID=A0A9N8HV51_9STRA|nr:elongation factor 2 kinase [Seminavis robusta]|eukprot:Sro1873_g302890.1 elongation factor 2 kinase (401) ;mRNA; r:7921-9123